jgi:hypothetical protein
VDEIFRQKPYGTGPNLPGGDDLVREVAKMANDKHTIGFKVAAALTGMRVGAMTFSGSGSLIHNGDPVKKEMILARMTPGSKFSYQDCTVSANIFFKRTGKIGQVSAFTAAREFVDRVQFVLESFKAACT